MALIPRIKLRTTASIRSTHFAILVSLGLSCYGQKPLGALIGPSYSEVNELRRQYPNLQIPTGPRVVVFVCKYQSSSPAAPDVRYFWQGDPPSWLPSLPSNHAIRALVKRPVGHCPDTLAEADSTREQLGPLWPPDDAKRIMGGQNHGAVFAAVLDTRSNLLGKWTHLKGFRNINDKTAPPAKESFRLLTETDLVELSDSQLTVKPIQYRGKTFCYWEPRTAKDVCEELLLHEWSRLAMGFDLGADKGNFDMFAYLDILAGAPPNAPTATEISAARNANSRKNVVAAERKAVDGFLTRDLKDSQALLDVHDGRFDDSAVHPDSFLAAEWLLEYIQHFATACGHYLPTGKIPITKFVCTGGYKITYLNGTRYSECLGGEDVQVRGRVCQDYFPDGKNAPGCTSWQEEGLFADPRLTQISGKVGIALVAEEIRRTTTPRVPRYGESVWQPLYDAFDMHKKTGVNGHDAVDDIDGIFERNACASPGMVRFQENLARFMAGEMPVLGNGKVQLTPQEQAAVQFDSSCRERLASFVANPKNDACGCLHSLFQSSLEPEDLMTLSREFTREHFLLASVARVGLSAKVRACIR